jgi:hypothetical protein
MKHVAYSRWIPLPVIALVALPLLPLPVGAQTRETRERQEEALRRVEERLARMQEELLRAGDATVEAQARYQEMIAALKAERANRLEEVRERTQLVETELADQARALQEMAQARQADFRAQARALEFERQARSVRLQEERRSQTEEARRRAEERSARVRERVEAARARLEDRIRDVQQVVVRVRARARLGVSLDPDPGEEVDRQGALITDVLEDSPAEDAGLQEGDIITHLDGHSLLSPIPEEDELEFGDDTSLPVQRLMALARELEDGQEVEVRYLREGDPRTVTLKAAEFDRRWVTVTPRDMEGRVFRINPEGRFQWRYVVPDEDFEVLVEPWTRLRDLDIEIPEIHLDEFRVDSLRGFTLRRGDSPNIALFNRGDRLLLGYGGSRMYGLELQELNPDLGEYFSTDHGVLVLVVDEDSELGLEPGDVILSVGDREVEDPGDVFRILGSYEEGEEVTFTVVRHGQETAVEGISR